MEFLDDGLVSNKQYSSDCNENLEQKYADRKPEIDFSSFFKDLAETETIPLPCVESVYESTPVSNLQSKPASSDCSDKKKTAVYSCSTCNKTFSRNCNLMQHMTVHKRNTTCSVSEKSFACKRNLKRPMTTHTQENSTVCTTCGKKFLSDSDLQYHMKIHSNEKLLTCEVCLKTFSTKHILKRHQLLHNKDEKAKNFKCEHCGYVCTRKDQWNHHVSCYQNSTYACNACNQKFCRRNNLRAHSRHCKTSKLPQKSNENPYCEQVKYFKRKNEMCECSTTTFDNCYEFTLDLQAFLNKLSPSIENEIKFQLYEKTYMKCSFMLLANVKKGEEDENYTLYLNSNCILIFSESMITACIQQVMNEMLKQYLEVHMDWKLCNIIQMDLVTIKVNSV